MIIIIIISFMKPYDYMKYIIIIIIIIIKECQQQRFPWLPFAIYSYCPSFLAGLLDSIQCPHR